MTVADMNLAKQQPGVNKGGRPDKIGVWHVNKAQEYADGKWRQLGDTVPTVEGMAKYTKLSRVQMYEAPEFKYTLEQVQREQARIVINKGLLNEYNSNIAKLLLSSKHGYVERSATDITSNGETINGTNNQAMSAGFAAYMAEQTTVEGEIVPDKPKIDSVAQLSFDDPNKPTDS